MYRKSSRSSEQVQLWEEIRKHGLERRLKGLMQPNLARALSAVGFDWLLTLTAFFLCAGLSWWFAPLAILIVGTRQAALNNLLHEASHKNLAKRASTNNFMGEWLCALPLFTTLADYRKNHMDHHRQLGDPMHDPDYLPLIPGQSWVSRWMGMVMNRRRFLESVMGNIVGMGWADRIRVACWWVSVTATLAIFVGWLNAIALPVMWLLARAVVHYPLSAFRELADHYGLDPSSWFNYTRNVEGNWLIAMIIHPHNDGYHLIHHLMPTIPFHRTHEAHKLLVQLPVYAKLHNCDGYFAGAHPLVKCLDGTCTR